MDTLLFEIDLANISLPREERRDASKLYNPMTVGDLTTLDNTTPWLDYINKLLSPEIIQVQQGVMETRSYRMLAQQIMAFIALT